MFLLGLGWGASIVLGTILLLAVGIPLAQAGISARHARFVGSDRKRRGSLLALRIVVWFLHLMQPMARLTGRLRGGLTPWRRRGPKTRPRFRPLRMTYWRDQREPPEDTLRQVQQDLLAKGAIVRAGGDFDPWDLEVRGGPLGRSRLLLAAEEHAPGKQLLRFQIAPRISGTAVGLVAAFAAMSIGAFGSGLWAAGAASAVVAAFRAPRAPAHHSFSGGSLRGRPRRPGGVR